MMAGDKKEVNFECVSADWMESAPGRREREKEIKKCFHILQPRKMSQRSSDSFTCLRLFILPSSNNSKWFQRVE